MDRLSEAEREALAAIFEAILGPVEAHGLPAFRSVDREDFHRILETAPGPLFLPGLRAMLRTIELATLPSHRARLSRLPLEARREAVERLGERDVFVLRQILSTLKILATFAYYEDPEVRRRTGVDVDASAPSGSSGASHLVDVDGRTLLRPAAFECDVVVVGSGPAGAACARKLAERGLDVLVVEEGLEAEPASFSASGLRAMARLYREMGTSMALGNAPMPFLQGCAVGGTSVVNGAINWSLPDDVVERWIARDPALAETFDRGRIEAYDRELRARLRITPTEDAIAGRKNLLLAEGAEALGLSHRPIARNVEGCEGCGRCLQGCPHGHKLSVDRNLLVDAVERGARVLAGMRVDRILHDGRRAIGVAGASAAGVAFDVRARRGVVLAASAIGTPALLLKSGLDDGPVGRHLTAHPGVSLTARFEEPVTNFRGATQGHEVTGLRAEGLKVEALGFDASIVASRVPGFGGPLAPRLAELDRYAIWGTAIRAEGEGSVRLVRGRSQVFYSLAKEDVVRARRAVRRMGEMFFAAGATEVYPGALGYPEIVRSREEMARFEEEGPLSPRAYAMSMTHLFGTTRMGSDPRDAVVDPHFEHHYVRDLYVVDSSVFPTNLGVNPQLPIMVVASIAAEYVARD